MTFPMRGDPHIIQRACVSNVHGKSDGTSNQTKDNHLPV
jgi:hypothetical protein